MYDLIDTHALVESTQADAQKEVTRYQLRIDNAEAVAREELSKTYGPQIDSLQAEIASITEERDNARARMDKLGVAVLAGIPLKNAPEFADLITGTNPDEYKAHAEYLLDLFKRL